MASALTRFEDYVLEHKVSRTGLRRLRTACDWIEVQTRREWLIVHDWGPLGVLHGEIPRDVAATPGIDASVIDQQKTR